MSRKQLIVIGVVSFGLAIGSNIFGQSSNDKDVLDRFLFSKNLNDIRAAYNQIAKNPGEYSDAILGKLLSYRGNPDNLPDSLLYIATLVRDERYIRILAYLTDQPEYQERRCIYYCAIEFSLAIYSCFTGYEIPKTKYDFSSSIRDIERLTTEYDERPNGFERSFLKASDVQIGGKLETEDLIRLASPDNDCRIPRLVAAYILACRALPPSLINDLYWLAITADESGSLDLFRGLIYKAIYKTEKIKMSDRNKSRRDRRPSQLEAASRQQPLPNQARH